MDDIFSLQEIKWLQAHSKTEDQINESLEDSLNVNPLDSGEPDLIPHQRAVKAAHITIEVAEKKFIAGPYDNVHWQIICKHISGYPSLINKEKTFGICLVFIVHASRGKMKTGLMKEYIWKR